LGVEPDQFKFAIAEAAEGKLTRSLADTFIQLCYMYDPEANRYTANARRMMAFGGAAFAMLLLGCTAPFWFSRRPRSDQVAGAANGPNIENEPRQPLAAPYNNTHDKIASSDALK
jgi:hypothetical protein